MWGKFGLANWMFNWILLKTISKWRCHVRVSPPILLPAPIAGRSPTSRRGEASRRGGAPWRRGNSGSRSSSSRSSKGWRGANWTWPCCSVSCSLQMPNTLTLFNIMLSPNIHMSQQLQDWTKLQTSKTNHINTLIHRLWPTSVMPRKHIWLRPWHFVMEGLTASCSKVMRSSFNAVVSIKYCHKYNATHVRQIVQIVRNLVTYDVHLVPFR